MPAHQPHPPPSPGRAPARRLGPWRRFRRDQDGATAVEFALIAVPFFGLLFALIETALVFWSTQVLETAVATASRQIYTGQFQTNNTGLTAAQLQALFKTEVCKNVTALFNCTRLVSVDVQTFNTFASTTISAPVSNGVYNTTSFSFATPARNQITVVRASMEYPTFATIMAPATSLKSGNQLIMATATFKTEPF